MKKVLILAVAVLLVAAGLAFGATVVGSKHDMTTFVSGEGTTQVCVFCHTPHQSTSASSQTPLWNHSVTATATFGVYASSTLNATPAEIGGAAVGSQSVSLLCMGCHDGTVAVNSLYKAPLDGSAGTLKSIDTTSAAYIGTSLVDDHPINFTYDAALATADGGLQTPPITNIPLFSGTLQCASCHNVHDNTNLPFLRVSNAGSALCISCHNK